MEPGKQFNFSKELFLTLQGSLFCPFDCYNCAISQGTFVYLPIPSLANLICDFKITCCLFKFLKTKPSGAINFQWDRYCCLYREHELFLPIWMEENSDMKKITTREVWTCLFLLVLAMLFLWAHSVEDEHDGHDKYGCAGYGSQHDCSKDTFVHTWTCWDYVICIMRYVT